MVELSELSREIVSLVRTRGQRMADAGFWIKVILIPLFACIAGVSQFAEFEGGRASLPQVIGITGTILVGVLSFITGLAEKDGGEELAKAFEGIEAARTAKADLASIDALDQEHEQALELVTSLSLMRSVMERVLVFPVGTEMQLMQALLKASSRNLRVALGFQSSHRWTITIYRAEKNDAKISLRPIATTRAIECDLAKARSWDAGTGIAGACFANQCEVVIPDLTRPALRELFGTKANERKGDDLELYRSMAASPIRVDGQQAPWGVVVATNDQLAHFNADAFPAMRPDIVVKELSGTLALAAAAFARVAALAVPLPDAADPATSGTQSGGFWLSNMIQSLFKPRRAA